jgi:hypothetical protein
LALGAPAGESTLPAEIRDGFDAHASARYLIYDETGGGWGAAAAGLLECVHDHFDEIWSAKGFVLRESDQPLVWVHFAGREGFDRYALAADEIDLSWAEGYYSARTHRVAVFSRQERQQAPEPRLQAAHDPAGSGVHASSVPAGSVLPRDDLARLTHEAAHQLAFSSGLLERGVMYPVWVSEGLALHFEADETGRLGTGSGQLLRRTRLAEAARKGQLLPLVRFLSLTRIPSDDPVATERVYDQAWGVFALLLEEHPASLQRYLQSLAQKPPGRRSQQTLSNEVWEAFDLAPLESAWQRFLSEAAAPPAAPPATRLCG